MMRHFWLELFFWPLLPAGCAQTITQARPHDNVVLTRIEYQDALKAWKDNDPNLERDTATSDPAELRIRIRRAAELSEAKTEKEAAYYDAIIHHTKTEQGELEQTVNTALPLDSRRQYVREDQARVQSELDDIENSLHSLAAGDEDLRPIYEEERNNRKHQLENLAQQKSILDDLARGQEARLDLLVLLARQEEELLKGWETTRSHAASEGEAFKTHYADLLRAVDERAARDPKNLSRQKTTPGSERAAKLAGAWVIRPPATDAKADASPALLVLEIAGDTVHGAYTAARVYLTIDGKLSSRGPWKLRWTTPDHSASGDIELTLTPDGLLSIERHTRSGKAPLSDGTELLVRRP